MHSDEPIHDLDVTSMYPYTCCQRLPVGHGTTFRPASLATIFQQCKAGTWTIRPEYEYSLIKMRIAAPGGLLLPVLPVRSTDKRVYYASCSSCLNAANSDTPIAQCGHSVAERAFEGTWTSLEVAQALLEGYHPICVYHVKYWDKKTETSDDVLKGYVLHFFKEKLQYSGVDPDFARQMRVDNPNISGEDIETAYIERIRVLSRRDFGQEITLTPGIIKDEPKRALAKLFLNSLWVGDPENDSIFL